METATILLILAAVLLAALVGVVIFLILQKRSIEQSAIQRADELIAESMGGDTPLEAPTEIRPKKNTDLDLREAA